MRQHWALPGMGYNYRIVLGAEARQVAAAGKIVPSVFVERLVEGWVSAFPDVTYDIFERLEGVRPSGLTVLEHDRIRERIKSRLSEASRRGEMVVLEFRPPVRPALVRKPQEESPEAAEPLSFAAIELVDEDGHPVVDQCFRITLPDGSVREGRIDSRGYARVADVPFGRCQVTFPGLDASSWEEA